MIILFGTRSGYLKTLQVAEPCKNCRGKSLELVIDQRFAHIFWIPIFPTKKTFTGQCYQCKSLLTEGEFADAYTSIYQDARKKTGTPFWSYSGSAAFLFIVLLMVTIGYIRAMKHQYMIQMPQRGDLYKYKTKDGAYSLLKVSEITGDTVFVFANKYTFEGIVSMRALREESEFDFNTEPVPILRSELINMFETGEILDIERD